MPTSTVTVKFGARTLPIANGTVASVKAALAEPTGLCVGEMRIVARGKVLSDASMIDPGAKVMLLRQQGNASKTTKTLAIRDIISGREAKLDVPATCTHDCLAKVALKALGLPPEAEIGTCLRLYLPHVASLMRIDLTLADYSGPGSDLVVYLVPCAPGLRIDSAASAEAVAEAARAEVEAAAAARAQIEAQVQAELLLRHTGLPASIVGEVQAEEDGGEDCLSLSASLSPSPSSSSSSWHSPPSSTSASLVPARIRTGLMPSMDDVQVVPVPVQALADLEAFEAYDAEMRMMAELPPDTARELMVAAEEARLEERCAMLIGTLEPADPLADPPSARPGTPAAPARKQVMSHPGLLRGSGRPCLSPSGKLPSAKMVATAQHPVTHADEALDELSADTCMSCVVETMETPVSLPQPTKPKAARKMSCKACACRLPLTAATTSTCACGDVFCPAHMHAHECSYDFRTRAKEQLAKANPKVEHTKLERM